LKHIFISFLFVAFFLSPRISSGKQEKADSLLQIISKSADTDTSKINALLELTLLLKKADTQKAFPYAYKALSLSEKIYFKSGIARSYNAIGDLYRWQSNYVQAREFYFKAFDHFKELNDQKGMSSAANYIGLMYDREGIYADALKFYYTSLRINESRKDRESIAISYNNIGSVNDVLGNYEEALSFYFKSLKIKEDMKNLAGVANTNNNIGEVYKKLGNYDQAMKYYLKSLQQKKMLNNKSGMANTLSNIGDVFFLKQEYKQSLNYYNQSLELFREIEDKAGRAAVNNNIGNLFYKMGLYTEATKHLQKGLSLAIEIGLVEEQTKAYQALGEVSEATGDFKKANEYIKLNTAVKDSALNEKNNRLVSEIQARYELEHNKKEIALLTKEKDVQQLEIYTNRILIISVSIGFVLLLVLVFVMVKGYREKQAANKLLVEQNQNITRQKEEKELLLKEIHHRVKNNLQIINSLLRLQSHQIDDERAVALFEECQNRIFSMAMIHEKLYKSKDLANINVDNYIRALAEGLIRSYNTGKPVELEVVCTVEKTGIDTLMPLGLILNELISNSLKYAFEGRDSGMIRIHLHKKENDRFEMLVIDNGVGLPDDFSWENSNTLGIELIKTLVEQINGTVEIISNQGTTFKIDFEDVEKE
jgi:two-component system, sensor histidine kinase PdtaS